MDKIEAVADTVNISGFPDEHFDELTAYFNQVELEFASEVDDMLKMFNMSHLRVRC